MTETPPSKRRCFTSRIVTVRVGEDSAEDFFIHEETLKQHSNFFKAALDKKWKEGQSLLVELPEDNVDVFSAYASWLYDGLSLENRARSNGRLTQDESGDFDIFLAKSYVLGLRIIDAKFCDAVIRAFIVNAEFHGPPGLGPVCTLYEGTVPGCPGRRLMVDMWVSKATYRVNIEEEDALDPDFAKDLLNAFLNLNKKNPSSWTHSETYLHQ